MLFESMRSTSVSEGVADIKVEGGVQAMVHEKVWFVPATWVVHRRRVV
jgi:hypothetical protein